MLKNHPRFIRILMTSLVTAALVSGTGCTKQTEPEAPKENPENTTPPPPPSETGAAMQAQPATASPTPVAP